MATVISEVVTSTARLYHDSSMGAHPQNANGPDSQHSYNARLNITQAQHHRTVPASPRPQATSIPPSAQIRPSSNDCTQQDVATYQGIIDDEPRRHGPPPNDSASVAEHVAGSTPQPLPPPPPATQMPGPPSPRENCNHRKRNIIGVKSLDHIQSFATEEFLGQSRRDGGARRSEAAPHAGAAAQHYDISDMPVADIIEMVAGLLTKITTTNDRQHESLHRAVAHGSPGSTAAVTERDREPATSSMASSVLAFHGKNVPPITILSYLSRIHKYCPTTYDVFLSLLVYFDRMTERVNAEPLAELRRRAEEAAQCAATAAVAAAARRQSLRNGCDADMGLDEDEEGPAAGPREEDEGKEEEEELHDSEGEEEEEEEDIADSSGPSTPSERERRQSPGAKKVSDVADLNHFFVVDGFNIHRLVIAGVTCASKFFSDVFYTNSRYAKVGGLPLNELNHLELQFLLLNDFRLSVPVEELEAYGTMLVEFYAREVMEQRRGGEEESEKEKEGGDVRGTGDVVMGEV